MFVRSLVFALSFIASTAFAQTTGTEPKLPADIASYQKTENCKLVSDGKKLVTTSYRKDATGNSGDSMVITISYDGALYGYAMGSPSKPAPDVVATRAADGTWLHFTLNEKNARDAMNAFFQALDAVMAGKQVVGPCK